MIDSPRAKDYVRVAGQLYFAVVSDEIEQGRALCWLRYVSDSSGLQKIDTENAASYIRQHYPAYLFHSDTADADLHGIPVEEIERLFKAADAVVELLELESSDGKQREAIQLLRLLQCQGIAMQHLGITGSLLINAQHEDSDIDLVVYGRAPFFLVRNAVSELIDEGHLQSLTDEDWRDAYARRDCSLSFADYCKHEKRKLNKCIVGRSKVDITMLPDLEERIECIGSWKKQGPANVTACVVDDRYAYDYPARLYIDHADIGELLVFTATYVGQAVAGETVEASGILEQGPAGRQRLIIGTSREARDEYLKVIETAQIDEDEHGSQQD